MDVMNNDRNGEFARTRTPARVTSRFEPRTMSANDQAAPRTAIAKLNWRTIRRGVTGPEFASGQDPPPGLSLARIFQIRVAVEAVFVEPQQPARFLEVHPVFADRRFHAVAKLSH